jgi:hypothetical protein
MNRGASFLMVKKVVCLFVIISLTFCMINSQSVNAEAAVTSELLKKELDGSCEIVDGLKELGFTSEQAKNILSLDRHDSTYYNGIQSKIDSLKKPSLALLSTTFSIDGYAIAVVVYYYDYYEFLLNRAKLASLQYSYSGRLALRTEEAIGEW